MLPSQREAFDIPRQVAWLNAAAWSPLPRAGVAAGHEGVARKAQPWRLDPGLAAAQHARARAAAAALIGASAADVAIIPSVTYGVATAAKILPVAPGSRVLVLADDHTAPVLEWMERAEAGGFTIESVARPEDGDWTVAVLAAIARKGAAPLAVASISSVHWSDGGLADLDRIAPAVRAAGAALLVDATHAVGVLDQDVRRIDPDILVFPTYKWVLGPYGRAFLYVAKRHQGGVPLEQAMDGRRDIAADRLPYFADLRYRPDATRFDMAERDHFITLEMASVGMEMMAGWGQAAVRERLAHLTSQLEGALAGAGLDLPPQGVRAPHILCAGFPGGPPAGLAAKLAASGAYAALRLGRLRISPHVYNDEEDIARFAAALRGALVA